MAIKIAGSAIINDARTLINYGVTVNALGSISGNTAINLQLGNYVSATVSGLTTFTFTNPLASPAACTFVLELTNGGSQTINWPNSVKWPGAVAPTLTTSGVDILIFVTDDGGSTWRGAVSQYDSR